MTFIKVWGVLALTTVLVSGVYAHQYGAAATSTVATPPATQNEAAVIARMQARMGDLLREKDRARRMQLMEMQMRDMDALDGGACRMKDMAGGKPMHSMPAMGQHGVMMAGAHGSCPMHSGAMGAMGCEACPKHDALDQRLKAVERRLDLLDGADKKNNR